MNVTQAEQGGNVRLIDWDTSGWGYLGEDVASLIADEPNVEHMAEYFRRCVGAYYGGFSEYVDVSHIRDNCVYELILILFGYRLVDWHMRSDSAEDKALFIKTLENIYEMRS